MGWLTDALKELDAGRVARVRPFGGSMACGRIESGQLVAIAPVDAAEVQVEDAVLVEWKGTHILHLVLAIERDRFLIGNNLGKTNGWVEGLAIRGKVIAIGEEATGSQSGE